MKEVVSIYDVCPPEFIPFVGLSGCKLFERVYMLPPVNCDDYTNIYEYMVRDFGFQFPLSSFEFQMLKEMQTASSQLHPNTWALLMAFQILCKYLSI